MSRVAAREVFPIPGYSLANLDFWNFFVLVTDTQRRLEPHIPSLTALRYRRPPIVEALVDLHIVFQGEPQLAAQNAMAGESVAYPTPQPIVATTWRMSASATDLEAAEKSLIGFRYDDKDAGRVVLVRFNGFTFSQQQPYPADGWAEWTVEARRLWRKYAEAFGGAVVSRIAVRYINRILVAEGATHADHFLVGPRVPELSVAHRARRRKRHRCNRSAYTWGTAVGGRRNGSRILAGLGHFMCFIRQRFITTHLGSIEPTSLAIRAYF